nr:putative methyltransferase tdie [Quercus suber]
MTFDGGFGRIPLDEKIKTVLDVGTGTGIWAMELADAFPHMKVYGTDLSPIQPDFVPPNCQFIVDNAELDWAFDYKFDYIHARMLTMGMHNWSRFFEQCWNHLEPNGWLETLEVQFPPRRVDGEEARESQFIKWGDYCYDAAQKAGIDARASEKFTGMMESRGFVNVDRVDVQWPIRPWAKGRKAKVMGRLLYENTQQAVPAVGLALFTRQLGWTKEQAEIHIAEALKDVDDHSNHFYYPM